MEYACTKPSVNSSSGFFFQSADTYTLQTHEVAHAAEEKEDLIGWITRSVAWAKLVPYQARNQL